MTPGDERHPWRTVRIIVLLAGLAYLGFYVYGLVLGVFDPRDTVAFTILAVVVVAAIVVISLRWRLGSGDPEWESEIVREENLQRERRGF
ncbi:MAG: hypothetical protein U0R24_07840 [Solirubrobacterales bacterium]